MEIVKAPFSDGRYLETFIYVYIYFNRGHYTLFTKGTKFLLVTTLKWMDPAVQQDKAEMCGKYLRNLFTWCDPSLVAIEMTQSEEIQRKKGNICSINVKCLMRVSVNMSPDLKDKNLELFGITAEFFQIIYRKRWHLSLYQRTLL